MKIINFFDCSFSYFRYIFAQLVIDAGTEPSVTFALGHLNNIPFYKTIYDSIGVNLRSPAPILKIMVRSCACCLILLQYMC